MWFVMGQGKAGGMCTHTGTGRGGMVLTLSSLISYVRRQTTVLLTAVHILGRPPSKEVQQQTTQLA
jgi:hypothetical protein